MNYRNNSRNSISITSTAPGHNNDLYRQNLSQNVLAMEGTQDHCAGTEEEEFPEEFQCCVCLDIMYKPVVLACGHISCFWCTFKAMDTYLESHCPVCRNPYNHFPRICGLLHFLLLKLYPSAYKIKAGQVAEEEKEYGYESPQFDSSLIESQFFEVDDVRDDTSGGDQQYIQDSSQRTLHEDNTKEKKEYGYESPQFVGNFNGSKFREVDDVRDATSGVDHPSIQYSSQKSLREDNASNQPTSSSQTTINEANSMVKSTGKVLVTHLLCAVCKELLYRPVVLNCGHVYCESCIHPDDSVYRCPGCQSAHPKGISNVCLILHHFLEEYFPKEYLARKESLAHCQNHSPSGSLTEKPKQTAKASSEPSGHRANFHPFVGCDYCGMCPIIGLRYRCKDCVERIGFDLCEGCYKSSSKLPGRFNQQHTKEHQFEVLQSSHLRMVLSTLGAELSAEDDETGSGPEENDGIA